MHRRQGWPRVGRWRSPPCRCTAGSRPLRLGRGRQALAGGYPFRAVAPAGGHPLQGPGCSRPPTCRGALAAAGRPLAGGR
ncbi:hypothetical protein BHE74_00045825 [Ensete ventricosum]|nr:hypothetical protein GW17_00055821 [Ensete ventricosum]RWW48137.1 hypothetical protein BHE74_00045825 [Ensete ventricosum]